MQVEKVIELSGNSQNPEFYYYVLTAIGIFVYHITTQITRRLKNIEKNTAHLPAIKRTIDDWEKDGVPVNQKK